MSPYTCEFAQVMALEFNPLKKYSKNNAPVIHTLLFRSARPVSESRPIWIVSAFTIDAAFVRALSNYALCEWDDDAAAAIMSVLRLLEFAFGGNAKCRARCSIARAMETRPLWI